MKKHMTYALGLTLLLAGCAAPTFVEDPVPMQEAPAGIQPQLSEPVVPQQNESAPQTSAQPEQKTQETVEVAVYQGKGYTISIPDSGWRLDKDIDDGAVEETWESTANDDVELRVSRYDNKSDAAARRAFAADRDDYRFDDLEGDIVTGQEKDGDVLKFLSREKNGTTYIVSWEYPARAAEAFETRLQQMADTFQLVD